MAPYPVLVAAQRSRRAAAASPCEPAVRSSASLDRLFFRLDFVGRIHLLTELRHRVMTRAMAIPSMLWICGWT